MIMPSSYYPWSEAWRAMCVELPHLWFKDDIGYYMIVSIYYIGNENDLFVGWLKSMNYISGISIVKDWISENGSTFKEVWRIDVTELGEAYRRFVTL
jgi:hypothetical protein